MGAVLSPPSPTTCPKPQPSDTGVSPHASLELSPITLLQGVGAGEKESRILDTRGAFARGAQKPEEEELSPTHSWT